ncbi:C4-dicarboxylate ABC transporter permease [Rhodoplanes elegans]|uniref:TRAP transporter small permease protein n=1 Tax=Rhodoplanes elegans TaxID=29408 RepID=A0A327K282_9BRAD|nr:TRAP transporter small permease [Rhodoplanes elegans]MBK5957927.1 C4-dicarboxylate ABC transporter permease [Rhodoplanes elegans]RAI32889.1 C4-dicarboxylate ABC transporter permease [Rhodoplanes elegans]
MSADPDPFITKDPPVRVPLTLEKVLAAAAMAALCLITLGNVIARYLTNYSFAFTEEFSIALMVVVTLLGAGIATAADRQIRIVFFTSLLPRAGEKIAEVIASLATIAMFGLLVWLGARLVWDEYRFEVTSPGLGEPQWIYTAALPLLSLAVIARAIGHLVRTLRAKRRPSHDGVEPL